MSLFTFGLINRGNSQSLCHTQARTDNALFDFSPNLRKSNNDNHYCLRVYIHVIRMSNGTGGQSVAAVNQAFQILQQDFNPHNIHFLWDNTIDYIDNSGFFNSASDQIFTVNNNADGIDIYLFDDNGSAGGQANGVGSSSEFFVSGSFWNPPFNPLVTSHVISHEMGHVLFLWHTHHGTINEGTPGECPELVDGSNSDTCGDLVVDTPADPHVQFDVDQNTCQWLGSGTDANGDNFNPDTENIMAYTSPDCMDYFTPMQGERMRNAIESLSFLQDCVVNNCPNCNDSQDLDLMVKDSDLDFGNEPNTVTQYMWTSEDIWVRHTSDYVDQHINPEYHPTNPNFVYVRVINESCVASQGTENLKLYWAKAATSLTWDYHWVGNSFPNNGPLLGNQIGSLTIPALAPGEETILEFPWLVPNPADYNAINTEPWHFCLLARIDASNDPMTYTESTDLNGNVRNNNNIAWKNVTVLDSESNDGFGGVVLIDNVHDFTTLTNLVFVADNAEEGKRIFEEAEVTFTLDELLLRAWINGGQKLDKIARIGENNFLIKGDNAAIYNMKLNPKEFGTLHLKVNFLTEKVSDKSQFKYHIVQKAEDMQKVIGGETYVVKRSERSLFYANAGEELRVYLNSPIVITAEDINEPAIYNWYNSAGELIFQGQELSIDEAVAETYHLEVISLADGFKDYSSVEVQMLPSSIELVSPNPGHDIIKVQYKLNNVGSAYLMVMDYQNAGETSFNYVLDTGSNDLEIDVSNYQNGFYSIALVCDGQIVDATIFSKQ